MQYAEGRIGRVFYVRIDHGDDLMKELEDFAREEEIRCGVIQVLGAVREARMVTGPEVAVLPPDPHFEEVSGGWEVVGLGSILWSGGAPKIHLHAAAGRGVSTRAGCVREHAGVYIIIEAIITEVTGFSATRGHDPSTGMDLPQFPGRRP